MGSLKDKRALVTGGAQGIGRAICEGLLAAGCSIYFTYHSSGTAAEEFVRETRKQGGIISCGKADLTQPEEAAFCVSSAVEFLGGIDILINNTGDLVARRTLAQIDGQFWQSVMDVNVTSMMLVTQACLPHLEKAGKASIVNMSSLAGRKGGHGGSLVYSTSKGAVLTWTRSLSTELAAKGIRVNVVAPGLILGTHFHATHTPKEAADQTILGIPLERAGYPEDVARPVVFLASEYDGFITGATLDINGGVYCA